MIDRRFLLTRVSFRGENCITIIRANRNRAMTKSRQISKFIIWAGTVPNTATACLEKNKLPIYVRVSDASSDVVEEEGVAQGKGIGGKKKGRRSVQTISATYRVMIDQTEKTTKSFLLLLLAEEVETNAYRAPGPKLITMFDALHEKRRHLIQERHFDLIFRFRDRASDHAHFGRFCF